MKISLKDLKYLSISASPCVHSVCSPAYLLEVCGSQQSYKPGHKSSPLADELDHSVIFVMKLRITIAGHGVIHSGT